MLYGMKMWVVPTLHERHFCPSPAVNPTIQSASGCIFCTLDHHSRICDQGKPLMGLRTNILEEPISELELRDLVAVRRGTSVRAAAEEMRRGKLGCAIVVDDAGKPIGKFTERRLMKLLLTDPR